MKVRDLGLQASVNISLFTDAPQSGWGESGGPQLSVCPVLHSRSLLEEVYFCFFAFPVGIYISVNICI